MSSKRHLSLTKPKINISKIKGNYYKYTDLDVVSFSTLRTPVSLLYYCWFGHPSVTVLALPFVFNF